MSPDTLPEIEELSITDSGDNAENPSALIAGEVRIDPHAQISLVYDLLRTLNGINANISSPKASTANDSAPSKSKQSPNRAAISAKAQAAKKDSVFATPSASAKRSARLKTSNYKPILAAGKGSKSRLEQMRKEADEKKAKEEEATRALQEQKHQLKLMVNQYCDQLLNQLPKEAIDELPGNYYELSTTAKVQTLIAAHHKFRGFGSASAFATACEKLEETGRVLGVSVENSF